MRDLSLPVSELSSRLPVRWTPLGEADAPAVSALNPALSPVGVRRRLRERQECLLGWVGESLAYYRWDSVAPANLPHIGRSIRPQSGDLLTLAAFTAPRFRDRGLHSAATSRVLRRARQAGLRRKAAKRAARPS